MKREKKRCPICTSKSVRTAGEFLYCYVCGSRLRKPRVELKTGFNCVVCGARLTHYAIKTKLNRRLKSFVQCYACGSEYPVGRDTPGAQARLRKYYASIIAAENAAAVESKEDEGGGA